MNTKGKIIAFEGIDYSFKETNSKKLYEYIKENITDKVILVSFPDYESHTGKLIKQYLNGDFKEYDSKYSIAMTYALNKHFKLKELKIKEKLEEGYYIIFDRYSLSNIVFQAIKLFSENYSSEEIIKTPPYLVIKEYCTKINNIEREFCDIPMEDCIIYMDMPVKLSHKLIKYRTNKNGESHDIHEENYIYKQNVEILYKYLLKDLNIIYDHFPAIKKTLPKKINIVFGDIIINNKYNAIPIIIDCIKNNEIKNEEEIFNNILMELKENNIL